MTQVTIFICDECRKEDRGRGFLPAGWLTVIINPKREHADFCSEDCLRKSKPGLHRFARVDGG